MAWRETRHWLLRMARVVHGLALMAKWMMEIGANNKWLLGDTAVVCGCERRPRAKRISG